MGSLSEDRKFYLLSASLSINIPIVWRMRSSNTMAPSTDSSPLIDPRRGYSSSPDIPLMQLYLASLTNSTLDDIAKRKATQPLDADSPSKRPKQESEAPSENAKPPAKRIVPFPEKPAVIEERNGEIEFRVVNNDGRRDSSIILTGLKCIFQKQLPKMPKDYIARLVYDRTHMSIAIVKKPLEVVGYVNFLRDLRLYSLCHTILTIL